MKSRKEKTIILANFSYKTCAIIIRLARVISFKRVKMYGGKLIDEKKIKEIFRFMHCSFLFLLSVVIPSQPPSFSFIYSFFFCFFSCLSSYNLLSVVNIHISDRLKTIGHPKPLRIINVASGVYIWNNLFYSHCITFISIISKNQFIEFQCYDPNHSQLTVNL